MSDYKESIIDTTPEANEIWASLGTHFDSICEILCEFIDNSISNYEANKSPCREIYIHITDRGSNNGLNIRVEDVGTGIHDIESAFTLGKKSCRETPLNEHGFGMKHALASANPTNDDWKVCSRTVDDKKQNIYHEISAPYQIGKFAIKEKDTGWIGEHGPTGTVISFNCTWSMFKAKYGGNTSRFDTIISRLMEDLGFIYSTIIRKGRVRINLITTDINGIDDSRNIDPIEPSIITNVEPGKNSVPVDLGNGEVMVHYHFCKIADSNSYKYYKTNQKSSGVEIRINGRLLCYNLLEEIWPDITGHNRFNQFLLMIDLESSNRDALPKTKASKNGMRNGDPKLDELYQWIRTMRSVPYANVGHSTNDEVSLFESLKDLKESQLEGAIVRTQERTYKTYKEKVYIDLYVFRPESNKLTIYEGKKDRTEPQDAYQLMMYWDGLVVDGIKPSEAILISAEHPESVKSIVRAINERIDGNGNHYNFKIKTWKDEYIHYPE